jgi:hypothetical protein
MSPRVGSRRRGSGAAVASAVPALPRRGRQYCAVDSITTSSTWRSTSQAASARSSAGLVPTLWRSNWKSPSPSTSATTTANILLCTSIPAILYAIGLSCGSGERALSHQSGSQAVVGRQDATTPNYSVNHARSGSHSCSASIAPWFISISPLPAPHSVQSPRFSFLFAGLEAQPHPVAEIVPDTQP